MPMSRWYLRDEAARSARPRLRRAGVTVVKEAAAMPWGQVECWVTDPKGNELRLVEVPEDHPLRRRI